MQIGAVSSKSFPERLLLELLEQYCRLELCLIVGHVGDPQLHVEWSVV